MGGRDHCHWLSGCAGIQYLHIEGGSSSTNRYDNPDQLPDAYSDPCHSHLYSDAPDPYYHPYREDRNADLYSNRYGPDRVSGWLTVHRGCDCIGIRTNSDYRNRNFYQLADAHLDGYPNQDTEPNLDFNTYQDGYSDMDGNPNQNAEPNLDFDTHRDGYTNRDGHADEHPRRR